jgi:hemolysin activation/secretion protein
LALIPGGIARPLGLARQGGAVGQGILRRTLHLTGILACLLHLTGRAAAQPAPAGDPLSGGPLPERGGSSAPNLPEVSPAPWTAAPYAPARTPPAVRVNLPNDARFVLRGVQVAGSTVLSMADIARVAAPFLGRPTGLADVEEIRRQVTLLYVDRGYINSGAVIPDQTVANGVLTLQAVEGRLTGIEVTGNRHLSSSYVTDRLRRGLSVPFNVNDLGRQQQILLQDSSLTRLNLSIQPGLAPGEARLVGDVTEASRYTLTTQVANNQSPTVGEIRGQLGGAIVNLIGVGDLLALQYGRSDGINDGTASYSLPIASDDTRISLRYDANSTLVTSQSLTPLNITSRYDSIGLGLSRPFYRTPEQALVLGLSAEWRRSQTFILGQPFSFAAGADNGKTNVTALRFYQDWLDRNAERVVALRSTFSLGVNALGATATPVPPTGQFFTWLGQAQYVRRIFGNWEVLARGSLQLSKDPLFPIEQFVLGGFSTVRGYREYLTATDNAVVGTLELRIPVGRVPLPFGGTTPDTGFVQLAPFFDHGTGWNTRRATPVNSNLSSVGLGVRWLIGFGTAAEAYYGYALNHVVGRGTSLQDNGLHFRIVTSVF